VSSIGGVWDDWWNHRPGGVDGTFSPGILGSVTSTALGLALALPHRRIVSLDTDGSLLMNTGVLCTVGNVRPSNLTVIVLDNEVYECIGSPPTLTAGNTDLARMADGAGCLNCVTVEDVSSFVEEGERQLNDDESGFIVAKIDPGSFEWPVSQRKLTDGVEDKYRFLRYVEELEQVSIHVSLPSHY
jgi:thiamine pyrophosphate-dependent acetolactate synthase large subunit-like protein